MLNIIMLHFSLIAYFANPNTFAAIEEEDYRGVSVEIIFNAETDSTQGVYIPLFNDECVEYDEYFSVDLSTTSPRVNTVNDSLDITIEDDDC